MFLESSDTIFVGSFALKNVNALFWRSLIKVSVSFAKEVEVSKRPNISNKDKQKEVIFRFNNVIQEFLTRFETLINNILTFYRLFVLKPRVLRKQLGQGMIEYLLMLLLTVALVVGLNRALGEPLRNYTRNYVGDMVRCIIDTGELPQRAMEICGISISVSFTEFSVEIAPNTPTAGYQNGPSSSATGTSSDRTRSDPSSRSAANRRSTRSVNSRPQSATGSLDNSRDGFDAKKKVVEKGTFGEAEGDGEAFAGAETRNSDIRIIRRRRAEGIGGEFSLSKDGKASNEDDLKPASLKVKRTIEAKDKLAMEAPPGPQPFNIEKKGKGGTGRGPAGEDLGFNFGKYLKWGIIIAILIIFGVFMMNQLNSIRKGWTS